MSEMSLLEFDSRTGLDEQLAGDVSGILKQAIEARGVASLVLSGGSTPKGFLRGLACEELDWSKVTVTLADDRWVPSDHEDSNDRLVRENLLQGPASAATFLPLVNGDAHPKTATVAIRDSLASLETVDVMILGMGGDGHFASLFPASDALAAGLDMRGRETVIAVDPPAAPHARMSMTLPRILDARHLILHIVGDDKRLVLERALSDKDPLSLPIAAIMASESPAPYVYWAP
ncbi:6-phosphogluconolactonase [Congregibacter sp.]|uniref:6-phosphogluconolactonase n=1 Tax=Congregibacter sp. TaxID=2744308 RepID=UPI00385A427E